MHLLHYAALFLTYALLFYVAGRLATGFWHQNFDFTGLSALGGVMQ
jgi:hypothetical protein